ncbi:MAG TPA: hypothetical protein VKE30_00855 [Chthoniobacterales bacterium]|nr:hypothetical protein [Chthoniobacterales bacterium]
MKTRNRVVVVVIAVAAAFVCPFVRADLVVDHDNNVFVPSEENKSIIRIAANGAKSTFATFTKKPLCLTTDNAGNLFVADSGGAIFRISAAGAKTPFASGLKKPFSLRLDGAGNLWAYDNELHALIGFAPNGKKKTVLRNLKYPVLPILDSAGNLLVPDYDSHSIFKITPDGAKTTFVSGVNDAGALVFDRSGNLFVYDNFDNAIVRIGRDGTKSSFTKWKGTARTWLLCDQAGNLLVPDDEQRAIVKFTPDGGKETFAEELNPVAAAFDGSDNLLAWDGRTIFKISADGEKKALFSDLLSPDQQWEYRCSSEGENAGIFKVGSDEPAVDLSENIPPQWAQGAGVLWTPDSKRVAINYRAGGRYNATVLYQLDGDKWKELGSPEEAIGKILQRAQDAQAAKEHLPKKTYRRRIWDSYQTRQWIDNNTAILYGYSDRSVAFSRDLSTNEEASDKGDLVAHFLFNLKFDPQGNWKIVKSHEMSAKEVDEDESD